MDYRDYTEDMYDSLIVESVAEILKALTDKELDDRQALNAVRRAEQEFVRKTNILDRFRDAHYDYTQPDAFRNYLCEDVTDCEEPPETEQSNQTPDAPHAPESVNADAMSVDKLRKELMAGCEDMTDGNGL